jgi:formate hydrogenlyase subunit 6/NADH:ubiquinone oxidoreductase subunit I
MGTHWIDEGCINCAACAEVCPVDVIKWESTAWLSK